jgi:hypothetical protein
MGQGRQIAPNLPAFQILVRLSPDSRHAGEWLEHLCFVPRPIAGSMRRRTSAFQLDCHCVRQPLLITGCPLHENAGSGGGPIQIPPGRHDLGVTQLLGQGTTVVTDLMRDFVPPLPSFRGNRDRLMRRVASRWDPHWHVTIHCALSDRSALRRDGSAFQLGCDGTRQPLPVTRRPLHENAGSGGGPIQIPPGRRGIGDVQLFAKGTIVVTDRTRDLVPPLPSFGGN